MNKTMKKNANQGSIIEVFLAFLKLGLTSFGGPIAHIGYFRKELIVHREWLSESQYGQLLAISQFLPGPASSQLGFSLGFFRAGWSGAVAAFLAFTLPSALLLVAFASLLPMLSGHIAQAAIHGLKIVAFAVVADAILGMSKNLCPDVQRRTIAVLAVSVLLVFESSYMQLIVVLGGAFAGIFYCTIKPLDVSDQLHVGYGGLAGGLLLMLFFCLLVGLPFMAFGHDGLWPVAEAFYQAGALVFGGGHVVLPLLQDSVVASGWVSDDAFLAGYGASQAIPGPMFAFSAYLGALIPSGQSFWIGASVALAFMFLPGFLLIAGVLPLWCKISKNTVSIKAIAGVNAAVVGLLTAALYDPIFTSAINNATDLAIGLLALALLRVWHFSALVAVAWCVMASILSVLA